MTREQKIITELREIAAGYGIEGLELEATTSEVFNCICAFTRKPNTTFAWGATFDEAVTNLRAKLAPLAAAAQLATELRAVIADMVKRAEALEAGKV